MSTNANLSQNPNSKAVTWRLSFYNNFPSSPLENILKGKKTIETRALNPEESDRYFGNIKSGDNLEFFDKNTGQSYWAVATKVEIYQSLDEAAARGLDFGQVTGTGQTYSAEEIKAWYQQNLGQEYLQKIQDKGLVAIWFKLQFDLPKPQPSLLIATHNPSKLKRYQKQLQELPVDLISLADLNLKLEPPVEVGSSTLEIVKAKARFYFEKTGQACFSSDSGLYFEGVLETEQPGQNVKGIAGATDDMSQEEIYDKMIDFYQKLATKYGGNLPGYFLDSYCVFDGINFFMAEIKRPIVLTNVVNQKDIHFPVCSLYQVKGKYYHNLTEAEMKEFLAESMAGLKGVIREWLETVN